MFSQSRVYLKFIILLALSFSIEAAIRFQSVLSYNGNLTPGDIIETNSRDFFLVGGSELNVDRDDLIVKLDSRGNLLWAKTIVNTPYWENFERISLAHDGGLVVTGYLKHTHSSFSAIIVKLNTNGTVEWGREIGGTLDN